MGEIQGQPHRFLIDASPRGGFLESRIASVGGKIVPPDFTKRPGFLRWLFGLVHQKTSWSPTLIVGEFWRFLISISKHREILSLLKLRPYAEIVEKNPGFALKYLVPNYLARGITETECVSCFLHHYRRMHAALPECVLRQILQGDVTFHEISCRGNCFTLTIGSPRPPLDKEGELSISLKVDGKKIFSISFTIVPGWVVKSEAGEILLITQLQGARGCHPEFKLVRKRLYEYSPRKLLFAALQGVADVFKVSELEAVCATNQRSYERKYAGILQHCYDDFFSKLGMTTTAAGFYFCPIPIEGKPLASFEKRSRARARKGREIRRQIQWACAAFLLGATDRAACSSSFEVCSSTGTRPSELRPSTISSSESEL